MNFQLIQLLVTLVSGFVILKTVNKFRKKEIPLTLCVLWSLFWILGIIVVWQPTLADTIASVLQVGRGTDAILYLSLVALFYLIFKIFVRFEKLDKDLTALVREVAILERKKSKD
ncbi:MAG: DUF2304 domain-containing protein [Patescibacteria group bacterium]|mgnify:CR=1 FL=1